MSATATSASAPTRKLLLMGAGGYTLEPESQVIDQYFLAMTKRKTPKICLLPTASGDSRSTIDHFHRAFQQYGAITSAISLFAPETEDIAAHLLQQDGIYITGGNTKSMLALWREWGVDLALRNAYENGVAICGISAGAICCFAEGFSDSMATGFTPLAGLGFLSGSFCPHYTPGGRRATAYEKEVKGRTIQPGIAVEDGVSLYYENECFTEMFASRIAAAAFCVATGSTTKMGYA